MKSKANVKQLLEEIFEEDFSVREKTIQLALREMHRKKRRRFIGVSAVLVVGFLSVFYLCVSMHRTTVADRIVETRSVGKDMLVRTKPLGPGILVENRKMDEVMVYTDPSKLHWQLLSDEELLALLERPAILVSKEGGGKKVIFLDGGNDITR